MRRPLRSLLLCAVLFGPGQAQADELYRYVGRDGRMVYTNIGEQVPIEQRASARLDLSHIPLNSEVGAELDRRFEQEHEQLRASSYCETLRAAAGDGFLPRLWHDFGPLVLCGGVLLGFLLFTPTALRRFGAPVWAKTLMMAIPSLAVGGLVAYTMTQTNRTLVELKERVKPCAADTFAQLRAEPGALAKRSALVEQLKREIAAVESAYRSGEVRVQQPRERLIGSAGPLDP
jgi:hypothetical protein